MALNSQKWCWCAIKNLLNQPWYFRHDTNQWQNAPLVFWQGIENTDWTQAEHFWKFQHGLQQSVTIRIRIRRLLQRLPGSRDFRFHYVHQLCLVSFCQTSICSHCRSWHSTQRITEQHVKVQILVLWHHNQLAEDVPFSFNLKLFLLTACQCLLNRRPCKGFQNELLTCSVEGKCTCN